MYNYTIYRLSSSRYKRYYVTCYKSRLFSRIRHLEVVSIMYSLPTCSTYKGWDGSSK